MAEPIPFPLKAPQSGTPEPTLARWARVSTKFDELVRSQPFIADIIAKSVERLIDQTATVNPSDV